MPTINYVRQFVYYADFIGFVYLQVADDWGNDEVESDHKAQGYIRVILPGPRSGLLIIGSQKGTKGEYNFSRIILPESTVLKSLLDVLAGDRKPLKVCIEKQC